MAAHSLIRALVTISKLLEVADANLDDGSTRRSTPEGLTVTLFRLPRSSIISALIQVGKYRCGLLFCRQLFLS